MKETVLYYTPETSTKTAKIKGVLVRLGIRIKNVTADQTGETIAALLGLPGQATQSSASGELPAIHEEVLVMHQFSSGRINELLTAFRKAGIPKIDLKAVVTESNSSWTFYELYEELKKEHEELQKQSPGSNSQYKRN